MRERRVLFIVEGRVAEPRFLERMMRSLFGVHPENVYSYGTTVHKLLKEATRHGEIDEYFDIKAALMEHANKDDAERLSRKYTDVFLIFDMDPHDQNFDPELLMAALRYFDDPTDNGKMYINYPMLESYKHLSSLNDEEYMNRVVANEDVRRYKEIVGKEGCAELQDLSKYSSDTFGPGTPQPEKNEHAAQSRRHPHHPHGGGFLRMGRLGGPSETAETHRQRLHSCAEHTDAQSSGLCPFKVPAQTMNDDACRHTTHLDPRPIG